MQSISVFLDIANVVDLRWKNAEVSRSQGLCQVNYIFFGSSLCKV